MAIRYAIYPNGTTGNEGKFTAKVRSKGTVGLKDLAREVAAKYRSLDPSTVESVFRIAARVVEESLARGFRVNIEGICQLFPKILGEFSGGDDQFVPGRHMIDAGATASKTLRRSLGRTATAAKKRVGVPTPAPLRYADNSSATINSIVTPGGIGSLRGSRLRFDPESGVEGVFFIDTDGVETKAERVQAANPKSVVFLVPPLDSGTYTVEVRACFTKSGKPRCGRLSSRIATPDRAEELEQIAYRNGKGGAKSELPDENAGGTGRCSAGILPAIRKSSGPQASVHSSRIATPDRADEREQIAYGKCEGGTKSELPDENTGGTGRRSAGILPAIRSASCPQASVPSSSIATPDRADELEQITYGNGKGGAKSELPDEKNGGEARDEDVEATAGNQIAGREERSHEAGGDAVSTAFATSCDNSENTKESDEIIDAIAHAVGDTGEAASGRHAGNAAISTRGEKAQHMK